MSAFRRKSSIHCGLALVRRDLAHDVLVEAGARLEDGLLGIVEAVLVLADVDVLRGASCVLLRRNGGVAAGLELERELGAAGAVDPTIDQDVHAVGAHVVEERW